MYITITCARCGAYPGMEDVIAVKDFERSALCLDCLDNELMDDQLEEMTKGLNI